MAIVFGLLLAAGVVVSVAPRLLAAGRWQPRYPRLALAMWHVTLLFVVLCVLAATGVTVGLAVFGSASGGLETVTVTVIGWMLLLCVGGAIVSLATGSEGAFDDASAVLEELQSVAYDERWASDGSRILIFDAAAPFACAVAGRTPTLVMTTGLRALLTDARLSAVLEHERAHLRYRHHLAMGIAGVYAGCVPRSRTARALVRTTRLLVELTADDAAARRGGAVHLANALAQVGEATGDAAMIVRAERLTMRRWRPARVVRARAARASVVLAAE